MVVRRDKKAAALASLLALMKEETGEELSQEDQKEILSTSSKRETAENTRKMEMEGVLRALHHRHMLMQKVCVHCNRPFETNLCWSSHCSDKCRYDAFEAQYGISWDSLNVQPAAISFWEYEPTLIISPDRVDQMLEYCKWFIERYDETLARSREMEETRKSEGYLASLVQPESIVEQADTEQTILDEVAVEPESTDEIQESPQTDQTESDPFHFDPSEFALAPYE